MKKRRSIAAAVAVIALTVGVAGAVSASASEWSWASYGFSGTAIANPDPFENTSYLIGGYVTTVNHQNPLTDSYVYDGEIILDTEGVALRFRFGWENTEPGYKAVADLSNGIAIYPLDESLDVAIVTESGVQRYSFPVPAAYDYMSANRFTIQDNGEHMVIRLCDRTVAVLRFDGTRTVGSAEYFSNITVSDGNGYIYGRCVDSLVLTKGCYAGYSSQESRALILVKEHSLESAEFEFTAPEEKETEEGWKPETEARETLPQTEPVTPPESGTETELETETEASPETLPETTVDTLPETNAETVADTAAPAMDGGCAGALGATGAVLMSAAAAAAVMKRKSMGGDHHEE